MIDIKELYTKLDKIFASIHKNEIVDDFTNIPESKCDVCKGENTFIENNEEIECFSDKYYGECFKRTVDLDLLYNEITNLLYGDDSDFIDIMTEENALDSILPNNTKDLLDNLTI
jgi:hypothetical protein